MAVTVDSGAIVGGGSGITGWSARSTFLIEDTDANLLTIPFVAETQIGDNASREIPAQSFTAGSSYSLAAVVLPLVRNGTPTDNFYVEIRSDNSDSPSSTVLATSNLHSSATAVSATYRHVKFDFASPPSLTNGTRYWILAFRDGGIDASNYVGWAVTSGSIYAGGRVLQWNGSSWADPGSQFDCLFLCLKTTKSIYQVVQDSGPALRIWKSTDNGSSYSELNSANAPAVNSATKPFSADYSWNTLGRDVSTTAGGQGIYIGYFSNTNTARVRRFDLVTQTWTSGVTQVGAADYSTDVDFNRNIRVTAMNFEVNLYYTSVADDADLEYVRYSGSMGGQVQTLVLGDTEASSYSDVVKDSGGFAQMFWYDCNANDFVVRSLTAATLGTATALDSSAADAEAEQASAVYQVYDPGTDTIVAAYIDSDTQLQERTAQLEVTSASITLGTQHEITTTNYSGRSLATCKIGADLYVFAGVGGTGIDYYVDAGATGTWSSVTNWIGSLTNGVLSTALAPAPWPRPLPTSAPTKRATRCRATMPPPRHWPVLGRLPSECPALGPLPAPRGSPAACSTM
jgi:hypothetical protein